MGFSLEIKYQNGKNGFFCCFQILYTGMMLGHIAVQVQIAVVQCSAVSGVQCCAGCQSNPGRVCSDPQQPGAGNIPCWPWLWMHLGVLHLHCQGLLGLLGWDFNFLFSISISFNIETKSQESNAPCSAFLPDPLYLAMWVTAQLGALCCIKELRKYLEIDSSHLVTDYKHDLSIINQIFLCLILSNLC